MSNRTRPQEIAVEVTEEDVQAELGRGLEKDEILPAGQHVFKRGGFLARHRRSAEQAPTPGQQRVTLYLDSDIIAFFQERAARPDAVPYQAQINEALREAMTRAHE